MPTSHPISQPRAARLGRHAALAGAAAFVVVLATLDAPGLVWDETIYLGFAGRYVQWFGQLGSGALSREAIESAWGAGQVHPPLGKLGLAAGIKLFHPSFPFCDRVDIRSFRLASACYFGVLAGLAYWWMGRAFGCRAGALSAAAMVLTPRLFGHAHFGTLDMPMAAWWFIAVALYAQAERSRGYAWAGAVALGAAGLTKINAAFIPFVLAPYVVWRLRRRSVLPVAMMAVVPTVMFFALWPQMWVDTWPHLCAYLADKASRMHVEAYYLGRAFTDSSPPWHYPLVLTAATVPVPLLLAAVGAGAWGLRRREPTLVLLAGNVAVVLGVACLPFAPKYDGVRLFLPAFPFIACLAGVGLGWLLGAIRRRWLAWVVGACLLSPAAAEIVHLHPYELSHYNAAAGCLAGAQRLGFEPTYWGDALAGETLDFLNRTCEPGARVAFFPVGSFVPATHQKVLRDLRSDLEVVDFESGRWEYAVLVSRYGKFTPAAWKLHHRRPVFAVRRWRVTLCAVYRTSGS